MTLELESVWAGRWEDRKVPRVRVGRGDVSGKLLQPHMVEQLVSSGTICPPVLPQLLLTTHNLMSLTRYFHFINEKSEFREVK